MDLKLTIQCTVEGASKSYDLEFAKDVVTIGRHSHCDVRIPDMSVGPDHARIEVRDGNLFLVDLGTGPATELAGRPLTPNEPAPLPFGVPVRIGGFLISAGRAGVALTEMTAERTSMVAMNMIKEVLGGISETDEPPVIEVVNDVEKGTRVELRQDREYKIGRESDCDLILKHWSISRRHALVRRALDKVTVMDLGSKNGITVNGERVTGSRILRDGDVIGVGHTEVRFRSPLHSILDSLDGPQLTDTPPATGAAAANETTRKVFQARSDEQTGMLSTPAAAAKPTVSEAAPRAGPKPLVLVGILLALAAVAALFLFVL